MSAGQCTRDAEQFGYSNTNEALYCGLCGTDDEEHEKGCPAQGRNPMDDVMRRQREQEDFQQCSECHYNGGMHNEGRCSQWRDSYGYDDDDGIEYAQYTPSLDEIADGMAFRATYPEIFER